MEWIPLIVVAALTLLCAAVIILGYNRLVTLRNRFKNGFSQIDVQLKRRYDLIPNLVEVVKGYLRHERGTLEAVIAARNHASHVSLRAAQVPGEPGAMRELASAEGALMGTLGRLVALAEAYPNLKANQTMIQLMEELTSTENRVAYSRQAYNDAVMTYNTTREAFPTNLIASTFSFVPAELFQVESADHRETPKVAFS